MMYLYTFRNDLAYGVRAEMEGRKMELAVDIGIDGVSRRVCLSHNCGRRMVETFSDLSGLTVDEDSAALDAIHMPERLDIPFWTADSKAAERRYRLMRAALFGFAGSADSQQIPYARQIDIRF